MGARGYKPRHQRKQTMQPPQSLRRLFPVMLALAGLGGAGLIHNSAAGVQGFASRIIKGQSVGAGQVFEGRASVVDGDTIEIHGQRIRLNGIDAPESKQSCQDNNANTYACGRLAAKALDEVLSESVPTRCSFVEWDKYGRFVGNCFRADGMSVQEWMVENGHALDWPKYSKGAFSGHQDRAKIGKRGIWQGEFQPPWEWRAAFAPANETEVTTPNPSVSLIGSSGCIKIKGNISSKGERIYHLPGQENYSKTRISENKGERWFCNETEARRSGWRRAKR